MHFIVFLGPLTSDMVVLSMQVLKQYTTVCGELTPTWESNGNLMVRTLSPLICLSFNTHAFLVKKSSFTTGYVVLNSRCMLELGSLFLNYVPTYRDIDNHYGN